MSSVCWQLSKCNPSLHISLYSRFVPTNASLYLHRCYLTDTSDVSCPKQSSEWASALFVEMLVKMLLSHTRCPEFKAWHWFLTLDSCCADLGRQWWWLTKLAHYHACGRTGLSSLLPASALACPSPFRHLHGVEQGWELSVCLCFSLSLLAS